MNGRGDIKSEGRRMNARVIITAQTYHENGIKIGIVPAHGGSRATEMATDVTEAISIIKY